MPSVTKIVGAGANSARAGSSVSWASSGNVTADDGSVAEVGGDLQNLGYTDYLVATMGGNPFAIASDQKIDGVEYEVEWSLNGTSGGQSVVEDVIPTSTLGDGTNLTDSYQLTTTPTTRTYGGASDTAGLALTPAVVNDPTFGVKLSCVETLNGNGKRPQVDFVRITVHYSPAPVSDGSAMMVL